MYVLSAIFPLELFIPASMNTPHGIMFQKRVKFVTLEWSCENWNMKHTWCLMKYMETLRNKKSLYQSCIHNLFWLRWGHGHLKTLHLCLGIVLTEDRHAHKGLAASMQLPHPSHIKIKKHRFCWNDIRHINHWNWLMTSIFDFWKIKLKI